MTTITRISGQHGNSEIDFDERDREIIVDRIERLGARPGPREGDWVIFADGVTRRISHIWHNVDRSDDIQTSDSGSWYLGHGYVSFSGGLFVSVKSDTLAYANETRPASAWIFHHDRARAHNAVDFTMPFRVYTCTLEAPTS